MRGGPAGSTAATLLTRLGHKVILLEKARHPRCAGVLSIAITWNRPGCNSRGTTPLDRK